MVRQAGASFGRPHIGLELPTEVEYDHGDGVIHPEQAEEDVVPRRHTMRAKVAVEDQCHRCMGRSTDNEEAANQAKT